MLLHNQVIVSITKWNLEEIRSTFRYRYKWRRLEQCLFRSATSQGKYQRSKQADSHGNTRRSDKIFHFKRLGEYYWKMRS